jgi:hypothetical protein
MKQLVEKHMEKRTQQRMVLRAKQNTDKSEKIKKLKK